jgi:PAS domain S-box-containing protein
MNPHAVANAGDGPGHRHPAPESLPEEGRWREQTQRLHYQELIDFALDGYLVTDLSGVVREANYAAAALLNYRKEFLLDKPLPLFVAVDQRRAFYSRLAQLAKLEEAEHNWEVRLRPRNRAPIHVILTVATLSGQDGRPIGLRWLLRDTSAVERAEQALRAEKTFSDALVQTALTAILVVDGEGMILRANPYLSALSGYSSDELLGQDWSATLIAEEDRPAAREMMKALLFSIPTKAVFGLVARYGCRRAVAWTGKGIVPTETGEPMTVLLIGQDVTALQDAQKKALEAERLAAIGQMIAGLAHESRNALQRSQSCLSVLALKLAGRPEELELLARIQRAQDDLHRQYEEVRGFAAPIHLDLSVCRLANLWREAWEDLAPLREGKAAELREETGSMECECVADAFRLKQVFRNLLENALAAGGAPPRVEVHCAHAKIGGREVVRVAVRDNGPGFDPEQRPKLFEPFHTTKIRGTGLGLAICKRVVEAHGGRIEAGEGAGPGAEVIITLPRRQP